MADLATLQTWLTAAETARHSLAVGSKAEELLYEGKGRVRYTPANATALDAYIASLKSRIAALSGEATQRVRPIHLTF